MKYFKKSTIYILAISLISTSCFQEIDTVALEKSTKTVITSNYYISENVTFYKIYDNTTAEVSNRPIGNWDLAFQSAMEGGIVLVNYTVSAKAISTKSSDFSNVDKKTAEDLLNEHPLSEWEFNDPAYSNINDSTALENWENGEVYLVNRGSRTVSQEAFYKVQFISKTLDSYTFKYAHIESAHENEVTINRTQGLANIYFSFETESVTEHEPLLEDWDFYFAPYLGWYETLTEGVFAPYSITGAMINNESGVRVSQIFDENVAYEDIDLSIAGGLEFTDWKGVIGSNWKNLPATDGSTGYTMDTSKKYVIKLTDGNYYKMRFLDFYNSESEKGYPSFEINLIQ